MDNGQTPNTNEANTEAKTPLFVGKTIASGKQNFKHLSPKRNYKKTILKIFAIIIAFSVLSGFAYLGYRFYKEGPDFIISIINHSPKTEQSDSSEETTLTCDIDLDANQLISYGSAKSGRRKIILKFQKGKFTHITRETKLIYNDTATASTSLSKVTEEHQKELPENQQKFSAKFDHKGTVTNVFHESEISALNDKTASFFDIPLDDVRIVTNYAALRRHYAKPSGKYSCLRQGAQIKD